MWALTISMKKILLLSLFVSLIYVPSFGKEPLIIVSSIDLDAKCSLSKRVIYGDNEKIKTFGGAIGHINNGKEYGARGCLLSIKVIDWNDKFSHCNLVGFHQPAYNEHIKKSQEQSSDFSCRFTKTPDGAFVFDSFGRRGSWCEFACQ